MSSPLAVSLPVSPDSCSRWSRGGGWRPDLWLALETVGSPALPTMTRSAEVYILYIVFNG